MPGTATVNASVTGARSAPKVSWIWRPPLAAAAANGERMPALLVGSLPVGMTLLGWNHLAGDVLYTPLQMRAQYAIQVEWVENQRRLHKLDYVARCDQKYA